MGKTTPGVPQIKIKGREWGVIYCITDMAGNWNVGGDCQFATGHLAHGYLHLQDDRDRWYLEKEVTLTDQRGRSIFQTPPSKYDIFCSQLRKKHVGTKGNCHLIHWNTICSFSEGTFLNINFINTLISQGCIHNNKILNAQFVNNNASKFCAFKNKIYFVNV